MAHWSLAELDHAVGILSQVADERVEGELVEVLREIVGRPGIVPAVTVES